MPKSNVSLVLSSRDATNNRFPLPLAYQTTEYNSTGQNIIQGQINNVEVAEVNFPYDIPNVQAGPYTQAYGYTYNCFLLNSIVVNNESHDVAIIVPPGFYTGSELAEAINAQIVSWVPVLIPDISDVPICSYSESQNTFTFAAPTAPVDPQAANWIVASPFLFPKNGTFSNNIGKDLLSIMGYAQNTGFIEGITPPGFFNTTRPLISGSAPLTFTQYIDICSPKLCKFQFFRDGSTTNLARRNDVICRLYITNNVAIVGQEGTRPFIIQRLFQKARVMRWTADNSIGEIDINLYDDCGQPLLYTYQPRPFQITFNVYEHETSIQ